MVPYENNTINGGKMGFQKILSPLLFFLIISSLLLNGSQIANAKFNVAVSEKLPYTPPFTINVGNFTFTVLTENLTSNIITFYPFLLENKNVTSFIWNYKPFWILSHGPFNRTWGHENESCCISLIYFNISAIYQLNAWLNADVFVGGYTNYSVVSTRLVNNTNELKFNITEVLFTCINVISENSYNITLFNIINTFFISVLPHYDGPIISVSFYSPSYGYSGNRAIIYIALATNLTVLKFDFIEIEGMTEPPSLINMLRILVPRIMVLLAALLIVVRLLKHYRIMKRQGRQV